jgi:transposase
MEGSITWVGIDAHKKTLVVAVLHFDGEVEEFKVDNDAKAILKLATRLKKGAGGREVRACYEAGTCGYTLQRRLEAAGVVCDVIAPSLIPRKPGDRIKTDRRDARNLAEMFRGELLTTVSPPSPVQEAVRDLCRCREDVRDDLARCRQRLNKMLVRRGYVFNGTQGLWSAAHRRWIETIAFDLEADRVVVAEYKLAIEQTERRLKALESELAKAAELPPYQEHVAWLRCFYGVEVIVAMTVVAEVHGMDRFDSPRALAAYLGLVPSLYASGDSAIRGKITKAGNSHVRRVLVQAAWQYRRVPSVGSKLRARRAGQPERVIAIAEEAQRRLSLRFRRLTARGKSKKKVVIAVARELVGFLWAALRDDRDAARHGARSSTQLEGVKASAAPRSTSRVRVEQSAVPRSSPRPRIRKVSASKTAVGQRRQA